AANARGLREGPRHDLPRQPQEVHHGNPAPRGEEVMAYKRKTWQEKLEDDKGLPKVAKIEGKLSKRWGEGTFVVHATLEIDDLMKKVRREKLITIDELRRSMAKKHSVTIACPITTGIFAWIAAHAADEAEQGGRSRITPYWRTLKTGGELNPKYPG